MNGFLIGSKSGVSFSLHSENSYTIGSGKDEVDLLLADKSVTSLHAKLTYTKEGWELEDLDSESGTFVQNEPLLLGKRVLLRSGAICRFGRASFLQ